MDTKPLVKGRIEDGRYTLERLLASGFDVSAAAWIQTADDEEWNLYVVSKTVEERGIAAAYGAAGDVLDRLPDPWVATSDLKLVRPDTPLGRHLQERSSRYKGLAPVHLQSIRLGDVAALEAYVYPPVTPPPSGQQPLTPQEVFQKVVGLMTRTDSLRPSRITLQDGTAFLGVPVGVETANGRFHVKFAVERPESFQVYPAEVIRAIE